MSTDHVTQVSQTKEPQGTPGWLERLAYGWTRQLLSCFAILGFVGALYSVGTYAKSHRLQLSQAPVAASASEASAPADARSLALRAETPLTAKAAPRHLLGARTVPLAR